MFVVKQSNNLKGQITVSGSKNASLPIISANAIINNQIKLENKPKIDDVNVLEKIISLSKNKKELDLSIPEAKKIRSSILLIPYGLINYGKVKFESAGGCNIGKRSTSTFDDALIQAGVQINEGKYKEYTKQNKPNKKIILKEFSVTATESLLTYIAFLEDVDYEVNIKQIAIEPHVINLIDFLKNIGTDIKINHDHSLTIKPQKLKIKNKSFKIIGDYIEAGTFFAIGATVPNSQIQIKGCNVDELYSIFSMADEIGINYKLIDNETIIVDSYNIENYKNIKIQTTIFPGFPTDLQSIFAVLLTQINGINKIHETLFEGRFTYLAELENLGAKVEILNPHQVIIIGKTKLKGGYVSTTDLRGGGAMLLAGIIAQGTTYITEEKIILRGYELIQEKLKNLGVDINRK